MTLILIGAKFSTSEESERIGAVRRRTYETPGYHRLLRVLVKEDTAVDEGLGCPLTAADRESAAQENRKRIRPWNIDETGAFFCRGEEVHFSNVSPPLPSVENGSRPACFQKTPLPVGAGLKNVALIRSTSMSHSKTRQSSESWLVFTRQTSEKTWN